MKKASHLIGKITQSLFGTSQTADSYYNKGTAKIEKKDYAGAIVDFTRVIEMNPMDADAYARRGEAKGALLDHQGAIADFNRANKINPTDAGF